MRFIDDKYFTAGVIIAIVGLYSASIYNYVDTAHAGVGGGMTAVNYDEGTSNKQVQRILEVVNSENGKTIFRPINAGGVIVPGSTCVIAAENVGSENEFIQVPASCFLSAD